MARPMPASPQAISSMTIGTEMPVGSANIEATKSSEYSPIRAASSMIGHGVSSRSSHSWAAGPHHVLGEVVHPLLELRAGPR